VPKREPPHGEQGPHDPTAAPSSGDATKKRALHELIGERAFRISQFPDAGTAEENWYRAERELAHEDAEELAEEIERRALEVAHRLSLTHP
jgi:hypothetical protein